MKKLISLALISTIMALPTVASAAGQFPGPFKNKGQCESALQNARNDLRKLDTNPYSPSEWNALVRDAVSCQQAADGTWSVAANP